MSQLVSRFAPSPTGFLHVGGARTAIFSWLLARQAKGRFILRIEDTDRERSTTEAIDAILDSMRWLGIDHDGEIVYQSRRADLHNEYIDKLIEAGHAYWCECTPDEVEAMRERARQEGRKPKYDGRCRERGLGPGPGRVVRIKTPPTGTVAWNDMVKGVVAIEAEELDDMILRRSDGSPTYNLAVVVDDATMGVTHVLRGEDHVSNTPRQILLYRAMGLPVPEFGHVPMILGPDKKKLSKRHGAVSVTVYRDEGFLPEALFNYLVRLGWSLGDQEIFSREELVQVFTTKNLGSSAAVFDRDKLLWLNAHYIKEAAPARLAELLPPYLAALNLPQGDPAYLAAIAPLLQPRAKTLVEMAQAMDFFLVADADLALDPAAAQKFLTPEAKTHLAAIRDLLANTDDFTHAAMEAAVKEYLDANGLGFKAVAQPMRVALTGRTQSPGLFETIEVLGKTRTLARLDRALA